MNLLIVDDEKLTREGLLSSIDFSSLNIERIETAEDGLQGLKLCEGFQPDIVLTDVRMPKMDGIRMMEGIQEVYPDTAVIFMSGFSDKEYLKAAIKLHAVSYVEKPIDLAELTEALKDALSQVERNRPNKAEESSESAEALAYRLLKASEKENDAGGQIGEDSFDFPVCQYESCFSVIIRGYDPAFLRPQERLLQVAGAFEKPAGDFKLKQLYTVNPPLLVFHFFSKRELSEKSMQLLGEGLTEALLSVCGCFHIVIGKQVKGYAELSHSYNTAVINLQQCFFRRDNTCYFYRHIPGKTEFKNLNHTERFRTFRDLLSDHKEEETDKYLSNILDTLIHADYVLPNQAREFYYRLFQLIMEAGTAEKLEQDRYLKNFDLWERVSACHSVFELDALIRESLKLFFQGVKESAQKSPVVYSIKNYIAENYENMDLSIMVISDYVKLSSSYVCTLFKSETGITLNQYITEVRLARARDLLSDPRNRIVDIAERVGYSDSNYFSKIFRKSFGLSPSEFREKAKVW
ncbi:MAG: response regulator [Lachnospiraceae bacterium]|nr:response regulator [Lachnospiraceae bacterium]